MSGLQFLSFEASVIFLSKDLSKSPSDILSEKISTNLAGSMSRVPSSLRVPKEFTNSLSPRSSASNIASLILGTFSSLIFSISSSSLSAASGFNSPLCASSSKVKNASR